MRRRVLLVGWDAADWKVANPLMDRGEMPLMRKLVSTGVMGNLATLEPMLSPLLWTSIATGKRAYDHGVTNFSEVDPVSGRVRPVTSASRRTKAIWEILAEQDLRSHVVGWFATHGEQTPGGIVVSNLFGHAPEGSENGWPPPSRGTIWPEEDATELAELRMHPMEIGADVISAFAPRWQEVDLLADERLTALRVQLAECFSVQAAATWILENKEWDFLAVYFRALDEISHHFMPFHPPRMEGVPRREFDVYKDVLSSAYRLHDQMLRRLIALAGPDTTVIVVSDHGFHSDHLRPTVTPDLPAGITVWHRKQGVFAAAGPGILADELVHGASLLDVTPTILALFGLPVGRDMEGKVLLHAFEEPAEIETIETWELESPSTDRPLHLTDEESRSLLDQFEALGYLATGDGTSGDRVEKTKQENLWSLARACVDGGRFEQALILLEDLHDRAPERMDFAQLLARCQIRLGLFEPALEVIEEIATRVAQRKVIPLLRSEVAYAAGQYDESLKYLEAARVEGVGTVQLWEQIGSTLLALARWEEAGNAFRRGLELDSDSATAWRGLAHCQLQLNRLPEAIDSAHSALALRFDNPLAHLDLGWACLRAGRYPLAEEALKTALKYSPDLTRAHFMLAELYREWGDEERATKHDQLRQESGRRRLEKAEALARGSRAAEERRAKRQNPRIASPQRIAPPEEASPCDFVIVTGLPRSGTSLMMQMLHAGGMELMSDGLREADRHNPLGYFEWEEIRRLREDPNLLLKADGKAVKVVSVLISALPPKHRYKVIFMRRPIPEILASQHRMRFGEASSQEADQRMLSILERHEEEALAELRDSGVDLIEIQFPELIRSPPAHTSVLLDFLGPRRLPTSPKIQSAVRSDLYHNRSGRIGG